MPLTSATSTASTSTDKGISTGVDANVSVFYTVPQGRKFTGNAFIPAGSYIRVGGLNYSAGSNGSGIVLPLTLLGGQSVAGYYMAISGIESDA